MKKSKRVVLFVLSMILVVSMAMSGIMTVNAAETSESADLNYRVGLLDALKISKISGVGISSWTGNLTRGEAAFLVAGLIQLDRSRQETIFDDVSTDAYYAGSIASLNAAGIVLKSWGSKKYKPDEPIKYAEFVTMLCKALGYMGYAEAKGGYPAGYIAVAKQFKLTRGVTSIGNDAFIDKTLVPKILMNALDVYYLGIAGIDSQGNSESQKQGIVLNDYFETYTYEGVLEEVGPYSITNNFATSDAQVSVGGKLFKISKKPMEYYDLLGRQVTVYYKEGNSAVCIYPDSNNATVTVDADDFAPQSTADVFRYYDEDGKDEKIKLSSERITLYNGSRLNGAELDVDYGNISFIDNDGDGEYDIVKITEYALATVTSIDTAKKTVTFTTIAEEAETFTIENEEDDTYRMVGTNGKTVKPSALVSGDIVLYAVNQTRYEENKFYDFIVSKNEISGKVTAIGGDELGIDGAKYGLTGLCPEVAVSLGGSVIAHVDSENRVFYMEIDDYNYKDAKYAVYLGFEQIKGGSKPQWEIELFTQDSAHVYLPVAEKIKINGGKKQDLKDVTGFFDTIAIDELIKYNVIDGEFSEIITADDWGSTLKIWERGQGFNKYTHSSTTLKYRAHNGGNLHSWLYLASDAIRFHVVRNERGLFDEEESTATTKRLADDANISGITLWDIDSSGKAHAYMTSSDIDSLGLKVGSNNDSLFLITKVIEAADNEGVPGRFVRGLMAGAEKEYYISSEDYEECGITNSVDPFCVGNAVKIITNGSNIVAIMKTGKNTGTPLYYTKAELTEANLGSDLKSYDYADSVRISFMFIAKVVYVEDGMVYLVRADQLSAGHETTTGHLAYPAAGNVTKYDKNATSADEIFTAVSWNDVSQSEGIESEDSILNGSTVLVNVTNFALKEIIILD